MVTVDPIHTFLLGMVRSESEHHITENSNTDMSTLHTEFYRRLNSMRVPYDIGRLPTNIDCKTSFSGLTAQQWKNLPLCMQKLAYGAYYQFLHTKACAFSVIL